jgi:sterol desaturase/sphingolipid hydroxylase (fatty acid hydroxylase superfamily)
MEGLKNLIQSVLGPDGYAMVSAAVWWFYPLVSERSFHWIFVAATVAFAFGLYLRGADRRGFLRFLFPRSVYLHPSALLDYKFYFVNQLALAHLSIGGFVISLLGILEFSRWIPAAAAALFGSTVVSGPPGFAALAAYSLALVLAFDFARFLAHYLMHRSRVLWEFHKVHHAAEVLTPITAFRAHPVEIVLDLALRTVLAAIVTGVFGIFYAQGLTEITVVNVSVITFLYLLTNHFRHSHIPFGYGPRLSRWLISPSMHQLHHSADARHFDKNFGFIFTLWDRLAGTHLVPDRAERYTLGLPPEAGRFDSLWALYALPIARAFGWRDPAPAAPERAR